MDPGRRKNSSRCVVVSRAPTRVESGLVQNLELIKGFHQWSRTGRQTPIFVKTFVGPSGDRARDYTNCYGFNIRNKIVCASRFAVRAFQVKVW